jgi:hypothetical protein
MEALEILNDVMEQSRLPVAPHYSTNEDLQADMDLIEFFVALRQKYEARK